VSCQVIAPALVPRKLGERVNTNRRDARKLAEPLRAGLLTEVRRPRRRKKPSAICAGRAITHAKTSSSVGIGWANCSFAAASTSTGGTGRAHTGTGYSLEWTQPAERVVVDDHLLAMDHAEARLIELDARLTEVAQADRIANPSAGCDAFAGSTR
jgi:hypothetical protein